MIESLTSSLDSGPKAEQSKMASQGVDSSPQSFADNMNELLTDELTMDITKPQQYGPKTAIDSVSDSGDSVDVASDSVAGEEGAFPTNFQQTLTDLTSEPHSGFANTAAGGAIPAELHSIWLRPGANLREIFWKFQTLR